MTMHIHVALFQWKETTTEKEIEHSLSLVRSVAHRVPDIVSIYCGENSSRWAKNFTHAVVVTGKTSKSIDDYRTDPVHVEAASLIEAMELDGIGVDFSDDSQSKL